MKFDPDQITIERTDKTHFLGTWRHPRDDQFAPVWNLTMGARATAGNYLDSRDTIANNARLSDPAKAEDTKAAARRALTDLGDSQRDLNELTAKLNETRLKLAEIPSAGPEQTLIDLELARYFRAAPEAERSNLLTAMTEGSAPQLIDALLRLPGVLFGVTEELRTVIEQNAIARRSPDEVRQAGEMSDAIRTAQAVLSKSVRIVTEAQSLSLQEQMTSLGADAWQPHVKAGPPDAMEALAANYGVA